MKGQPVNIGGANRRALCSNANHRNLSNRIALFFERISMRTFLASIFAALTLLVSGCSDSVTLSIEHCYPSGMAADLALTDPARTLGATGDYNYTLCSARYERVISAAIVTNGAIPNTTQSRASFVGIDSAHFALTFESVWNVTLTPASLRQALDTHCSSPSAWGPMLTKLGLAGPDAASKFQRNQCANSTYVNTMLFGNNGLFRNNGSAFARTVSSEQNGATVLTWTRGYLLQRYGKPGCTDCQVTDEYRIVIDAGSSGTRLSLYQITANGNGAYPQVTWLTTLKLGSTDKGIDDFVRTANPGEVNTKVIGPLFTKLQTDYTNNANWLATAQNVKVDLLATAGMREAEAKHGKAAIDNFYALIKTYITNQAKTGSSAPANRTSTAEEVRTIDGNSEEGVWSWTNLNDHYCRYFKANPDPLAEYANTTNGMYGVVEVGGASTQVSFPVSGNTDPANNRYAVTIGGKSATVYNKTFLGLGQDLARTSMAAQ